MNSNEISFPAPAHWIDGQAVPFDGPAIEVLNPATGAVIATVPDGTAADVDRAVSAATAAFPAWAATDPAKRAAVLSAPFATSGCSCRIRWRCRGRWSSTSPSSSTSLIPRV